MKTEDLMIGDWIRLKDDSLSYEESCMKITFLSNSTMCSLKYTRTNAQTGLRKPNEDWLCPVFIDDIEPIPLTPEILEKNGFEKLISNTRMFFHHGGHRLSYYIADKHFTIYNQIDGSLVQRVIVNVHELQHALKLCGIDKEIVV